jgi:hypothetical protein
MVPRDEAFESFVVDHYGGMVRDVAWMAVTFAAPHAVVRQRLRLGIA